MTKAFWKNLKGSKENIREIDDCIDDKEFEAGVLQSNLFFEVTVENGDADDEDAACILTPLPEYTGKVPSKKWLNEEKAYVLDFGTEVYSWIGSKCSGAARTRAAEVGLVQFNKKYETQAGVHPYDLNASNANPGTPLPRPEWSVYGRFASKTESVAFRRKFYDWPDPVDLKVKTVDAKIHAQLTKEFSSPTKTDMLVAVPSKTLKEPTEEPLMLLDNTFIGRGKGMKDWETLFTWGITLNQLTVWQISGADFDELPKGDSCQLL